MRSAFQVSAVRAQKCNIRLLISSLVILCVLDAFTCGAQTNVTTWHNDIGRTGQNLNETILTTSNVNATQFGKLFSQPVDGAIFAQPLYLSNVTIAGQQHNVVFVATENDSVYAFDADNNGGANINPLWQASLLTAAHGAAAGATAFPASELCADIVPVVGITGTPVIDSTTNTLYVVSKSQENGNAVQRLHALDVTTGNEKFNGPVVITATIAGTGNGSVSGQLTFDSMWENQRPGLLLLNGIVYVAFAAHGDNGPWHGWIFAYNAGTLAQSGVFNASSNGVGSGLWMSGAGLAADQLNPSTLPYGRMFVATGNGDYTATTPYNGTMDFGDSILRLDLTNGVPTIKDVFTPSNQAALDSSDNDLGAGGLMVLPTQTTGSYPNLLVQTGKAGNTVLLNRENLGGYNATDNVVQETNLLGSFGVWSSPAYWNGTVYYAAQNDNLIASPLANGQLSTTPPRSSETYAWPGATPSISANGSTQGIAWTIDSSAYTTSGPAVLAAHNAGNVATTLYSSNTNLSRDNPGPAVKFTPPTIVNGKVYVATATQLSVYGLLAGTQQAATPVLTPGTESFNGSVSVSITDSTSGAAIYYTTNGSTPTAASTQYTGPIVLSSTTTVNAVASASGYLVSPMASATYTNITQASPPTFSAAAGTYTTAQSVTISDTTSGATIYYTTTGTTPSTSSTKYAGTAISVSTTETLEAIAVATGYTNSAVATAAYTIQPAGSGISFPQGFASSQGLMILNGSTDLDDSRLQLTDGGTGENGTAWYATPVNVQSFSTTFTFQLSNPAANGITFAIQNQGTAALGLFGQGLGYEYIPTSVAVKFDLYNAAGEGPDSTGLYTDGAVPTVPAIDLSSTGINLHSDDTMSVQLLYNGTTLTMTITDTVTLASYTTSWTINIPATVGGNTAYVGFTGGTGGLTASQKILTWAYTPGAVLPTPVFSPVAGTYTTAQSVTISDSSSGATIYYTTNGTTPTTSSTKYSGTAISVSTTETLEAIAVASGFTNSAVATAAYTIATVLPTPTFSVAAGTYTTAQSVTISDSSSGATIYYTTNGTTPTTSSTKYSGTAISVSTTETLEAIAVASGFTNSAVATAAYTIATVLPTPTFSVAAGTYTTAQSVTISDSSSGATIYYTTNGTTPTTSSTKYSGTAISVSTTETLEAIAVASGFTNSSVATAAYTIATVLPTPTFSVAAGTYTTAQSVTISDSSSGATIYYTTNGTTPTTSSTKYSGTAISVSTTETLEAIAVASGFTNSAVATAAYTIATVLPTPTFSVAAGTYTTAQSVTISDSSSGATIYYTTNGTTPTTSSTKYSGTAISVSTSETLEAIAVASGFTNSVVATAAYTIASVLPTPVFSPIAGNYASAQSVTISDSSSGATIYYTTNGTTPTTSSTKYSGTAISVSTSETLEAIAVASGFTNSAVATAAYTIASVLPAPTFSLAAGNYTTAQTLTITDAVPGTTIYYTTNDASPTTSSTKYTGPITISSSEAVAAFAAASGYHNSATTSGVYLINNVLPTPLILPAGGTYSTSQTVTIREWLNTDVYYTTDGTTPTTSSTRYTGPFTVASTETVKAIVIASPYTNSPVATAAYTIQAGTSSIGFGGGFAASQGQVVLNGTTQLNGSGLQLTNGGLGQEGSAWYVTPVNVQSFTTNFTFQLTNAAADGFTFTIQNQGTAALGIFGSGLGYEYIPTSVAVKFDLFNAGGEGSDSTGIYTNGAIPTVPAIDLSSTGINLHSGDAMAVQMVYNGTTLTMTITDSVTHATYTTSFTINIPATVGGNTAYVGFTGGTGGLTATQTILTWTYTN